MPLKEAFTKRILAWFTLGFLLLGANAWVSYGNINKLNLANDRLLRAEQALKLISEIQSHVTDAETAQRGYMLMREERYLEPYHVAIHVLPSTLADLQQFVGVDPQQADRARTLQTLIGQKLAELEAMLKLQREKDQGAVVEMMRADAGKLIMDRIRSQLSAMQAHEDVRLVQGVSEARHDYFITLVTFAIATLLNLLLFGAILYVVLRDARARSRSASDQLDLNEKLIRSLADARLHNQEITLLGQLSGFLQAATSSAEACIILTRVGPQLFPDWKGEIYMVHPSRNYLGLAASWNEPSVADDFTFAPEDCWALRLGAKHVYLGDSDTGLVCSHVRALENHEGPYLCVPMTAQGDTLGLLHLRPQSTSAPATHAFSEARLQLATAVAEQAALALANLRLRETLRQQSIRDTLTGLYNRRFLEESLDREMARMARKHLPLTVIMIDADHFKVFNDTYGHEAGDAVLRDLGQLLRKSSRDGDIACRFGGEEFTILMLETPIEIGMRRAEFLRQAASEMKLSHNGQPIGHITLSMGVAMFPEHGLDRETLLNAADAALYAAKRAGRNRVMQADGTATMRSEPAGSADLDTVESAITITETTQAGAPVLSGHKEAC